MHWEGVDIERVFSTQCQKFARKWGCNSARIEAHLNKLSSPAQSFEVVMFKVVRAVRMLERSASDIVWAAIQARLINWTVESIFYLEDCDRAATTALISFCSKDHIIMTAKLHPFSRPSIKERSSLDWTRATLLLSYGPELLKSLCAVNTWCIGTRLCAKLITSTINVHCTFTLTTRAWIVSSVIFDNVVFDQWASGPSVHSQICVSIWIEWTCIIDCSAIVSWW